MTITQQLPTTHKAESLDPSEWHDWWTLGGAVGATAMWLYRRVLINVARWIVNWFKMPFRVDDLHRRMDSVSHDTSTAIGIAQATWDSLPFPIWRSDPLGMCVHVNTAYCEVTGYQLSELSGTQWKQIVYHEDKELVYREWASAVADNRPFDLLDRWITREGKIVPVHTHASLITLANGRPAGWVAFVTVLGPPKTRKLTTPSSP